MHPLLKEELTVNTLSHHTGIPVANLQHYLGNVEEHVLHTLKLLKYAEFCTDGKPNTKDEEIYRIVTRHLPYNTPLFRFITLERFARMRRKSAFKAFKETGIQIEGTLKDFILFPLRNNSRITTDLEEGNEYVQ